MFWYLGCFIVGLIAGAVLVWIYKSRIAAKVDEVREDLGDKIKGG